MKNFLFYHMLCIMYSKLLITQILSAGIMRSTLIEQVADGASNVREVWKFSFSDC